MYKQLNIFFVVQDIPSPYVSTHNGPRAITSVNSNGAQCIPIVTLYNYLSIVVGKMWLTFFCFSVSLKQNVWS